MKLITVSYGKATDTIAECGERNQSSGFYIGGSDPPHYPVPAKRMRTFEFWRNLGKVSALNNFDIEIVHSLNRYK